MRFYTEILNEPQRYLEEICENPHQVFSNDFIYYLAELHNLDWHPNKAGPAYNSYQPHPLSPCTKNVKNAMEQVLVTSLLNYEFLYEELVPDEAVNKLELFTNRAIKILGNLTYHPLDALFTLLHLGRWTILFYERGTKDAVYLVPHLMANALKKIVENSSMWFFNLDVIAEDLTELLRNGFREGFIKECYLYFEELDDEEDHFDECSLCICGQCGDSFEPGEEYDEDYDKCNHLDEDSDECNHLDEDSDECNHLDEDSDECNHLDEDSDECNYLYEKYYDVCNYLHQEDYDTYEKSGMESGEFLEVVEEEDCEESTNDD